MLQKKSLLGVLLTDATSKEVLEYVMDFLENKKGKLSIVTPNPEFIVYANRHKNFQRVLNDSQISLCDGIGLYSASKILGKPIKQRIAGIDFMESLCREVSKKPITVGFLGGKARVAERTTECLQARYPGLKVGFVGEEWPSACGPTPRSPNLDILFVAFGFPKQEEWIAKNLDKIGVRVAMAVGGAFDYISGQVPRAPFLIRAVGLEWLFRLVAQPWRWRRQRAILEFVFLVLKEKFSFDRKG